MRIISGQLKGRKIVPPKNLPVRPTTDMAKEALFNILNNSYDFDELSILDLFAGSGNISFDFASRAVQKITSVDNNFSCIKFIKQTAEAFEMPIEVLKADAFKFVNTQSSQYDIIFSDPPYEFSIDHYQELISAVFNRKLLTANGVLILEHEKQKDLSHLDFFNQSRNYGGCMFSFFENDL